MTSPLVLSERDNGFAHIELCYHGAHADRKLTLRVELADAGGHVIEVPIPEARAMDAFNHPFAYLASS